jgi:hypothetical protein
MYIKIDTSTDALIPTGTHIIRLQSCEIKRVNSQYAPASSTDGKVDKLLWRFTTETPAPDGQVYEYVHFTGTAYGNDRAALTLLLDQLAPGMNRAIAAKLDINTLVGKRYRTRIVHKTIAATGKVAAQHVFIEPVEDEGTPAVSPSGPVPPTSNKPALAAPFDDGDDTSWN